jgi:hypothetical protein
METLFAIGFFLITLGYCVVQIHHADRIMHVGYYEIILDNLEHLEPKP